MSATSASGLDGDSTKSNLVSGLMAFFQASRSVKSTKSTATSNLATYFSNKETVEPNTAREQIT